MEFELLQPPSDGISSLKFSSGPSNLLLASSWDTSVRLYDVTNNKLRMSYNHDGAALDCCFAGSSNTHSYSGGLNGEIRQFDFTSHSASVLGKHEAGVKCIEYCPSTNLIISGSWDSTIKVWDHRTSGGSEATEPISTHSQPGKVFTMALSEGKVVVGTAGRHVWIWDLRNMKYVLQKRESSLKYQTRCIRTFPNGQGFVLSSIEGRVAVEYFDPSSEVQKKKYAFKCHRTTQDGVQTIYPVNAVAFHPIHGTFATGGGDRMVNIWDAFNRKRLYQLHAFPTSISALAYNHDGSQLAIASSYTFEEGEKDHPPDSIFIRSISDADAKPR